MFINLHVFLQCVPVKHVTSKRPDYIGTKQIKKHVHFLGFQGTRFYAKVKCLKLVISSKDL